MNAPTRRLTMRVGAGLLLGGALAGCNRESPVAANDSGSSTTVAIDLSELHRPPGLGMQQSCASLAARVALQVTPQQGAVQTFTRPIPAEASTIRFESIDVTQGSVAFSVNVTSDNGTLLYGGNVTQQVGGPTFQVSLPLAKLAPVLQVCPGHIVLDRSTEFSETLQVFNRGIGSLAYEALAPPCDHGPCIGFEVPTGTAVPEQSSDLLAFLPRMTTQTALELQVKSAAGSVPVTVTLGQLPDLVVDSLLATAPSRFGKFGIEQPVRVVVRNEGNAAAGVFKVAAEYIQSDTLPARFIVPGQTDTSFAFTQQPLAPGAAATFEGIILIPFIRTASILLRVTADSCIGDQLGTVYCRVDEFDEGNNVSAGLFAKTP